MKMSKLISIGKVLNFHGIKGEIKMGFSSGKESLIKSLKKVFIFQNNQKVDYDVMSVRFHKNFAIVKLKQINSIDDVMTIKGLLVHVTEDVLKSNLDRDEFLVKDLIGCTVFDEFDNKIGRVSDVGQNKAGDLLEIEKTNGLKFIVPFVKEWVSVVNLENNKIVIKNVDDIDISSSVNKDEI